eukprot:CAMPEP_0170142052 /NCGR_PEP_ID=MMETSP0033_2-20121228/7392_1 /TAXON_ID=195969 /ORGANISM="Dolichomastix tenuilepis, Strain CCMP3274" /LENGTH=237 /DNA_ID=CAMNT_0010378353 /DNA_START=36 /DNA_END=746 /DNA_ORIENTATION=+
MRVVPWMSAVCEPPDPGGSQPGEDQRSESRESPSPPQQQRVSNELLASRLPVPIARGLVWVLHTGQRGHECAPLAFVAADFMLRQKALTPEAFERAQTVYSKLVDKPGDYVFYENVVKHFAGTFAATSVFQTFDVLDELEKLKQACYKLLTRPHHGAHVFICDHHAVALGTDPERKLSLLETLGARVPIEDAKAGLIVFANVEAFIDHVLWIVKDRKVEAEIITITHAHASASASAS